MMTTKLPLDGLVNLIDKMSDTYVVCARTSQTCPEKQTYRVASNPEDYHIEVSARKAAFSECLAKNEGFNKVAFDTRRINQQTDRNPRTNLQYWHRADEFISEDDQKRITTFSKLLVPLNELKEAFGTEPEWHESYARVLYDAVNRILRTKQGDGEFFRPHLAYLEQLLEARYRLKTGDVESTSVDELKEAILKKDEGLKKRGLYAPASLKQPIIIQKDGQNNVQETLANAIFGSGGLRRDGEKSVERVITITIMDTVVDSK